MASSTLDLAKFPVLVVDDEQDNLDAFRFNFGKNFRLLYAQSGEEALDLARQHDVAVVVTDQRMPRMTGLELLRAAREARPGAIGIIVTAFTDVDVLIEAINLGRIYRYVTKPWAAKELRGILTHASVLTVTDRMCRWPIGDPTDTKFAFCGRESCDGPYCSEHARLGFQPTRPRQRKTSNGESDELRRLLRYA